MKPLMLAIKSFIRSLFAVKLVLLLIFLNADSVRSTSLPFKLLTQWLLLIHTVVTDPVVNLVPNRPARLGQCHFDGPA